MQNVNHPTAVNGEFFEGDPGSGLLPTRLPASFMNTVLRELRNVVLASGQQLDPENDAQVLGAIQQLGDGARLQLGRNFLDNAEFAVSQRHGIGLAAIFTGGIATRFASDRWAITRAAPENETLEVRVEYLRRFAAPINIFASADVPLDQNATRPGATTALFVRASSFSSAVPRYTIRQRIEEPFRLSGESVAFSIFHAFGSKQDVGYRITTTVRLNYGEGGPASALVATQSEVVEPASPGTAEWGRIQCTGQIPNLDQIATIGPGSYLEVEIEVESIAETIAGAQDRTSEVRFTGAQLELGESAGSWQRKPYAVEFVNALRYYENSSSAIVFGQNAELETFGPPLVDGLQLADGHTARKFASGNLLEEAVRFRLPKRVAPAVRFPTSLNVNELFASRLFWNNGATWNPSEIQNVRRVTSEGFYGLETVDTVFAGAEVFFQWEANADFFAG